jgi:hypothetical protein
VAKAISEITPGASPNLVGRLTAAATSFFWPPTDKPWYPFLSDIAKLGRPLDEVIGNIVGLAVGASVNYAHASVNVVDFYLSEERAKEKAHIQQIVGKTDSESQGLLRGYVCEAMRLKPQFNGLWRHAVVDATISQGADLPPLQIKAGDHIWGSFRNAHLNPKEFPEPTTVNPRRPYPGAYNLCGAGFHNCPGTDYAIVTIVEVVKAVFSLKNIRRAPGDAGKIAGFTDIVRETETDFFIQRNGKVDRWPGSLHIVYDS